MNVQKRYTFDDLRDIIEQLRSENGCPWDKVQTHESLRADMLEEAYEAVSYTHLSWDEVQEPL